jgi:hypothetical protein
LTNLLKVESAFTRGIRKRLDASVIKIAAAVEYDVFDAFLLGTLGDQFADRFRGCDVGAGLGALAQRLLDRRGRDQCRALRVVDELSVNVL